MIAHLKGVVLNIGSRNIILDVNGVGYLIVLPRKDLERIQINENTSLFIHTHVREDEISLYGFQTIGEWEFFRLLLTVSGIGPRTATEILNVPIGQAHQAIVKRDLAFFVRIPGIGKKTAERLCIDLEGKLPDTFEESVQTNEEIVDALVALGFSRNQVHEGLKKIPAEISNEREIIQFFLRACSRKPLGDGTL